MSESKRTTRINIRINDSVAEKLESYSQRLGMAPSTVAAQFVCEGLLSKEMTSNAIQSVVAQQLSYANTRAEEIFSDPEKAAEMFKALGIQEPPFT